MPTPCDLLIIGGGPGVFAAGDVRSGSVKRIAASSGEGNENKLETYIDSP